jgi:hypothetical protein
MLIIKEMHFQILILVQALSRTVSLEGGIARDRGVG